MSEIGAEPWTIQRLLSWTADYFQRQNRDVPRMAAEILLAEALGCRRIDLYTRFGEIPAEPQLGRFRDWVRRHAAGEPVAYLVGHRDFYSLRFLVSPDVLIPRAETELLVVETLDALKQIDKPKPFVVDVGTGSGCIAIAVAKHAPNARILAVDVSTPALEIAARNAQLNRVAEQIEFLNSDLFAAVTLQQPPDVIVSNPPYVGSAEPNHLDADVRRFEPAKALFGGERGSELIERLVNEAAERLAPGGFLIFETSPMLATRCRELVTATGQFASCLLKKDLAKLDRAVVARKNVA